MQNSEFDERYIERLDRARSHWWTRGMQHVALSLLGDRTVVGDALDDGCGAGASLPLLQALGVARIHAMDVAIAAVRAYRALEPSAHAIQASATQLPYADSAFDLIVSADVLQHMTSERAVQALREMGRVLRPSGRALIRTNAAFGRSAVADRADWRLYRPEVLALEIRQAGLVPSRVSHVNAAQGLWASLPRPRRRRPGQHDHARRAEESAGHGLGIPEPAGPIASTVGGALLRLEARWLRGSTRRLPFGHTLVAVAVKPSQRETGPAV